MLCRIISPLIGFRLGHVGFLIGICFGPPESILFHFCYSFFLHKTTKTTWVPDTTHLQAGNYSDSNEKERTTSVIKHINDHNVTGITQVSIRDRFRPCSRTRHAEEQKQHGASTKKPNSAMQRWRTELAIWHYAKASPTRWFYVVLSSILGFPMALCSFDKEHLLGVMPMHNVEL